MSLAKLNVTKNKKINGGSMKKLMVSLMLIISMFAFAAESAPSATVGYVKYPCTLNRSFVALPMQGDFTMASTMNPNFDAVSKYDAAAQTWLTANYGMFGWMDDFAVTAGQAYYVNSTTAGDFIVDGAVVTNPAYNLVTNRNAIMLPLTKSTMTMASDYGTETGVINAVSKYDGAAQTWLTANYGMFGWMDDFAVSIADPHYVNATGPVTWPGAKGEMAESTFDPTPKADPKMFTIGVKDRFDAEYDATSITGITFKAWMLERPTEVLNQNSPNSKTFIYGPRGACNVDLVGFTTPYAVGETLYVLMKDENEGLKAYYEGEVSYTLTEIGGSAILLGYEDLGGPVGSGSAILLSTPSSIDGEMLPMETKLHQNYPNPFNPTTTIKFDLNSDSVVKLNVYNYNGQMVKSLVDGSMKAGFHTVNFDASNLSAGVYYYTMETANKTMTQKMVLVK